MAFNYNYITNRTSPNQTAGRGGSGIKGITIHWYGLPKDANPDGVVNWLCNPNSQVSAHIVTTGTGRRVWQLVADTNTAWHAGTWNANISTIGIEADPRCRDEDYDVLAEVIANLWKYYGKLPLYRHSDFIATQCPGNYDLNRLARLAEEKLNPKPKPAPAPKPVKQPVPNAIKLPVPVFFKAKLDKTNVWDLETNPSYKAVTTIQKGNEFRAYAQIKFNNSTYYVTEYSYGNGNKHGVNSVDLKHVTAQPTPKPTPAPTPAPKPVETPTPAPEPIVVQPTPEEVKQQEENTRKFREEMERLSKENNTLLKSIQSLVQWIVDKLKAVFK